MTLSDSEPNSSFNYNQTNKKQKREVSATSSKIKDAKKLNSDFKITNSKSFLKQSAWHEESIREENEYAEYDDFPSRK